MNKYERCLLWIHFLSDSFSLHEVNPGERNKGTKKEMKESKLKAVNK